MGDVERCAVFLYEGEGGYLQRTMETDNHEVQSDKSEKSLIRCNVLERNLQNVNEELCIQKRDQLDEREGSKKLINHMHQIQYNQCVNKKPRSMIATLCEVK